MNRGTKGVKRGTVPEFAAGQNSIYCRRAHLKHDKPTVLAQGVKIEIENSSGTRISDLLFGCAPTNRTQTE